jgi:tetratricopeptide (TPR) repeat protein
MGKRGRRHLQRRQGDGQQLQIVREHRMDGAYAMPHCNLGVALRGKGLVDEAIVEYREAIRLKEDLVEAHHGLANALADKGLLVEAVAEYRRTLQINKDDALAHCNLGLVLQRQCEFRKALAGQAEQR